MKVTAGTDPALDAIVRSSELREQCYAGQGFHSGIRPGVQGAPACSADASTVLKRVSATARSFVSRVANSVDRISYCRRWVAVGGSRERAPCVITCMRPMSYGGVGS